MRKNFRLFKAGELNRIGSWTALLIAAGLSLLASAAQASGDLRVAALKAGDLPAGFSTPHTSIYHSFTSTMKVKVAGAAGSVDTICLVTGTSIRTGWVEGMVQGFDTKILTGHLRVCGVLLKNASLASTAYHDEGGNVTSHIKIGLETKLTSHVGQASVAGKSSHAYEIVFRTGTAVIAIDYSTYSGKLISPAVFLKMAKTMSSRIH